MSVVPSKPETRQQAKTKAAGRDDPKDIFSQWRKGINPMGSKTPVANREVLATLRANVGSHNRPTSGNGAKPLAQDPGTPESTKTVNILEKRPSTNAYATSASKRARVNTEREATVGKTSKAEEERWTAKWIKVFPSLVFYFEIGAEEGPGKSLKGRVLKMGAVSYSWWTMIMANLIEILRGWSSFFRRESLTLS